MSEKLNRRLFLSGAIPVPFLAAASSNDGPYIAGAREFLDTMITKGTDRFGRRNTPLFCLSLDPEMYMPPKAPEKADWEYRRSFEHLYRDRRTVPGVTRNAKGRPQRW